MRYIFPAFFSFLLMTATAYPQVTSRPIRIGIISDFSAKMASWGRQTLVGAELARQDLERERIIVNFSVEDAALQSGRAVSAAHKLLEQDRVAAIYAEFSPVSTAISPVVRAARKLLISDAGADSVVSSNPYAFKVFTDFTAGCRRLAQYWKESGIVKAGMLRIMVESGEQCSNGARSVYPDLIETQYNPGEDLKAQILLLKQRGVSAIFNPGYEPDLLNTSKAMRDLNIQLPLGSSENAIADQVLRLGPEFLNRLVVIGLPVPAPDFVARVLSRSHADGRVNLEASALSFTHIKQLARAIAACREGEIDCQMSRMLASPPDDTIGFRGWINRTADREIELKTWKDGRQIRIK